MALSSPFPAPHARRIWRFLIGALVALAAIASHAGAAHAQASQPTVRQTTIVLAGGEQRGAAVACPAGQRITGGGVGTFDSVDSKILASGPLDETGLTANTFTGDIARFWYAAVYNRGTVPRAYRVFALCSPWSDARVAAKTIVAEPGSTHPSGFIQCPAGQRVVGGGIGTTVNEIDRTDLSDASWQVMHSGPLDGTGSTSGTFTGDIARFWYASLRRPADSPAAVYKVFALCSRFSDATVAAVDMAVPAHGVRDTFINCTGGRVVTGGGVGTPATPEDDYLQVSGPLDETGRTVNTIDGHLGVFWYGNVFNASDENREYRVFALCASVS
jgi:hypothetical protein